MCGTFCFCPCKVELEMSPLKAMTRWFNLMLNILCSLPSLSCFISTSESLCAIENSHYCNCPRLCVVSGLFSIPARERRVKPNCCLIFWLILSFTLSPSTESPEYLNDETAQQSHPVLDEVNPALVMAAVELCSSLDPVLTNSFWRLSNPPLQSSPHVPLSTSWYRDNMCKLPQEYSPSYFFNILFDFTEGLCSPHFLTPLFYNLPAAVYSTNLWLETCTKLESWRLTLVLQKKRRKTCNRYK